jgi:hypothetical protein
MRGHLPSLAWNTISPLKARWLPAVPFVLIYSPQLNLVVAVAQIVFWLTTLQIIYRA